MTRIRRTWVIVAILLSCAFALTGPIGVLAQSTSKWSGEGQIIARGVDTLTGDSVHWRISTRTAQAADGESHESAGTGFAIAVDHPLSVTDSITGQQAQLEPGQGHFLARDSSIRVASATMEEAAYLSYDLTTGAPGTEAAMTTEMFAAPVGAYDIQLTSGVMMAGANSWFTPVNNLPYLVYASSGDLIVTDAEGEVAEIAPGQALQFTGPITMVAGQLNGASWLIASIGEEVGASRMPAGSLVIAQIACPSGTTNPLNNPDCGWSTSPWDVIAESQKTGERWTLKADGAWTKDGSWTIGLPAGAYTVTVQADPEWTVTVNNSPETTLQVSILEGETTYVVMESIAP